FENRAALCGGSLINSQWILSAAHCFSVVVYLGETEINNSPNSVSKTVSQIIVHENYNKQTQDNDVSLLKLTSPVTFNDYISPVCLAEQGSNFPGGTTVWVTGFGTLSSGETGWSISRRGSGQAAGKQGLGQETEDQVQI
uniref:Peptidase S1 domain-containing protein n=1 Tax=Oryzias latipes TaxID=8090 RepID=A0A3B3HAX1_ORYLA